MDLRKRLSTILTSEELGHLVLSYDVVGDIAIIIVPPELSHQKQVIGNAILETNKNIKVVAKRDSYYHGNFRTIKLEIIGGENRKETIHKEFGIRLCLNLEEVYFSVRSSTERRRIASLVKPGENILVMFSGVAPYPLHIARFSQAASIIGIEENPAAHRYGEKNVVLNKAENKISLLHGDVSVVCPRLEILFDRIVMPLPKAGFQYISVAISRLKTKGSIHFYTMQSPDTIKDTVLTLKNKCLEAGRRIIHHQSVVCGHTGPNRFRYCIDADIR